MDDTEALPDGENEWSVLGEQGKNTSGDRNGLIADIMGKGHYVGVRVAEAHAADRRGGQSPVASRVAEVEGVEAPALGQREGEVAMVTSLASLLFLLLGAPAAPDAVSTADWKPYAVREEIAPRSFTERDVAGRLVLGLAGRGDDAVDGRWVREAPVVPGRTYAFRVSWKAQNVESPARSVLARLVFLDAAGEPMRPMEYPVAGRRDSADGWTPAGGVYPAPEKAAKVRLELHLRWTANGEVRFRHADFQEMTPLPPRRVTLATVNHRPRDTKSAEESRERFVRLVEEAAAKGADIVCLPEGITLVGNGLKYAQVAEPIPGPSTEFLAALAKRLRVWLVAGIYERTGNRIYNTAVLIGRDGSLAGRYRKMALPDEEIEGGITPGSDTPVFQTDFGRVGLMICWDSSYPEVVVATVDLAEPTVWPWLGNWRARIDREAPAWGKGH